MVAAVLLAAGGGLDPSFGDDGTVVTRFGDVNSVVHAVAVQGNGTIVAAGRAGDDFALARYNGDGSTGFSATTDFGGSEWANSVAVDEAGRIVVGGVSDAAFALARYAADGSLDRTFAEDGTTTFAVGRASRLERVFALADGRLLAVGTGEGRLAFAWFREDGTHEKTVLARLRPWALGVVRTSGGKIVVSAPQVTGDGANRRLTFVVARFNADGRADPAFGGDGVVAWRAPRHWTGGEAVAVQPDGKVVVAAHGHRPGAARAAFGLVRFRRDGGLDGTFGTHGVVTSEVGFGVQAVTVDARGRIVAAGAAYGRGDFTVVRYTPSGRLDRSFGAVTADLGAVDVMWAVAAQRNGRVVVAGQSGRNLSEDLDFALARFRE